MPPPPAPRPSSRSIPARASADTGRTCPNCAAFVPKERKTCEACRLEVAKMDAFAAAKRAAQQKGIRMAEAPRPPGPSIWPAVIKMTLLLILVAGAGWGIYKFTRPRPPRWAAFPPTGQQAAQLFLTRISGGQDETYNQAYSQIADSVRDKDDGDEPGEYRQLFHNLNLYLSGEFGDNWITQTTFEPDPTDPNAIVAHVALETLHIRVADQQKPDPTTSGPHFGILGISEFNIRDAAGMQKMAAINGIIGGVAGQGAVDNLQTIIGAGATPRHETPMQKKVRLLPIVRDPRTASSSAVLHLYPIRTDPVVRNRLTLISQDDRYDPAIRERADLILKDRVPEEDLAAAGVE